MSAASELFFGSIEQHEPESMTFGQFLSLAPEPNSTAVAAADLGTAGGTAAGQGAQGGVQGSNAQQPRHYYLAQADIPITQARQCSAKADCRDSSHDIQQGAEQSCRCATNQAARQDSLLALTADFQQPPLLSGMATELQTHLWMSIRQGVMTSRLQQQQPLSC
jgi:hypothetical protein